jgi:hypothetical protein
MRQEVPYGLVTLGFECAAAELFAAIEDAVKTDGTLPTAEEVHMMPAFEKLWREAQKIGEMGLPPLERAVALERIQLALDDLAPMFERIGMETGSHSNLPAVGARPSQIFGQVARPS